MGSLVSPRSECPCGSGRLYKLCCGRLIDGGQLAITPEELMRSRYTAFTLSNMIYLKATIRGNAQRDFAVQSAKQWSQSVLWKSLVVLDASPVDAFATQGSVTFEARYFQNGQLCVMSEKSLFERIDGQWFYVSAELSSTRIE